MVRFSKNATVSASKRYWVVIPVGTTLLFVVSDANIKTNYFKYAPQLNHEHKKSYCVTDYIHYFDALYVFILRDGALCHPNMLENIPIWFTSRCAY